MPPTDPKPVDLETTLREFHEELTKVEQTTAPSKELIAQVRADLDRIDQEDDDGEGLLERIEDAALEFNAEHPVLAGNLRRIAHFLSGAGV